MNRLPYLAWILAVVSASACAQTDELAERGAIMDEVTQAMVREDFPALQRLYERYTRAPAERTASGAFKITMFQDGVHNVLEQDSSAGEAYCKHWDEVTERWAAKYPDAPLAYELHGAALTAHGGFFRGRGYANTVTPQAWEEFARWGKLATDYLAKHGDVAGKDSGWYIELINTGKTLGWPKSVLAGITEKGIAANPEDYRLYLDSVDYLLPKWGGSAEEVDRFINHVIKLAPRDQGSEFYARLYSGAAQDQFHHSLYSASMVEWPKMKKGLEDWNARYPTNWNKNIFAYHACIAGDKPTTRRLLRELDGKVNLMLWEPNERSTYETCRRWAQQADEPVLTKPSTPRAASGI